MSDSQEPIYSSRAGTLPRHAKKPLVGSAKPFEAMPEIRAFPGGRSMPDKITLLLSGSGRVLAKVWQADGNIVPAANAVWFKAVEVSIDGIEDIHRIVEAVETEPSIVLIKDAIAPNADKKRLRRRTQSGVDEKTGKPYEAGLIVVERSWVIFDVEGLPLPEGMGFDDGDAQAAYVRKLLPPEFQQVACVWQLSGSAGHPTRQDQIRLHLFFMLDTPVFPKAWKSYFAHHKGMEFVDQSAFDPAKLIFIAAPVIQSGFDPIGKRHGLLEGEPFVIVPKEVKDFSAEIARGENKQPAVLLPRTQAPMPRAAAEFVDILAQSNILRSQDAAYQGDRARRLALCAVLRDAFGITDEEILAAAFWQACVGPNDPNGEHDFREALTWFRRPSASGRTFSARRLMSDAAFAAREAGDFGVANRAVGLAMALREMEAEAA